MSHQQNTPPIALRLKAAARHVNVSESTLTRWRRAGLIKPVKINGTVLFRVEDLERLLRDHTVDRAER